MRVRGMSARRGLLIAAYALLLAAAVCALALFGVQTYRLRAMQQQGESVSAQLEAETAAHAADVEEKQALAEQLAQTQALAAEQAQQIAQLEAQCAQLQAELDSIPQYTLDVRALPAGEIVDESEIDRAHLADYFTSDEIEEGDAVYARIYGKSYVDNDDIALSDLRYMKLLHYNFDHQVQVGELIVNRELVPDFQEIFLALFENGYEIQSMYLIDNYWKGDGASSDSASIEVNNTSAFCYRGVVGGSGLSNHALGRAIDINPQQNPYVTYKDGKPRWSHRNADDYIDRDTGLPHVITHDDLCYQLFKAHGFDWGGDWKTMKDYQHFDKEK
ncbi:MAG: M15 family metallopeptidase [Candidatus Spyradocola sp.]